MATPLLNHNLDNYRRPLVSSFAAPVDLKAKQPIVSLSYMEKELLIPFLFGTAVDV